MLAYAEWGEDYPMFIVSAEPDELSYEVEVADDLLERYEAASRAWDAVQKEVRAALMAAGHDPPLP